MHDEDLPPDEAPTVSDAGAFELERKPPERIGPYRVLGILGKGGMGVVYRAEQAEPVRREVALKVIKLGMDTEQVVARFAAERQALALMDHPHIARVLEAGATPDGRPYFAMEYVPGIAITSYCDKRRLPVPERLDLFARVCDAVQHAIRKGSSTATSSPPTSWSPIATAGPCPR